MKIFAHNKNSTGQNSEAITASQMNPVSEDLDEISLRKIAGVLTTRVIVTIRIGEALGNYTVLRKKLAAI